MADACGAGADEPWQAVSASVRRSALNVEILGIG
jgi:hypothetical protein